MILKLQRLKEVNNATLGELFADGVFVCYTLEDKVRPEKIKHETCIPSGTYLIEITYSPTFNKLLPLLLNVPGFYGIRIHAGNSIADSSGCILVGTKIVEDKLLHSISAFTKLFTLLQKAAKTETLQIDIHDIPQDVNILVEQIVQPPEITQPVIEQPAQQTQPQSWKKNFWLNLLQLILNLLKKK